MLLKFKQQEQFCAWIISPDTFVGLQYSQLLWRHVYISLILIIIHPKLYDFVDAPTAVQ